MSKQAIIDRFEGAFAIVEYDEFTFDIPRVLLPDGAKEGDVLEISIALDPKGTENRRDTIRGLEDDLFL